MKIKSFVLIGDKNGNPIQTFHSETTTSNIIDFLKIYSFKNEKDLPYTVWLYEEGEDGFISAFEIKNLYNHKPKDSNDFYKNLEKRNLKLKEMGIDNLTESQKLGSEILNIKI